MQISFLDGHLEKPAWMPKIFRAALFVRVKKWKQYKCPPSEWTSKHIHSDIFYKENEWTIATCVKIEPHKQNAESRRQVLEWHV